MGEPGSPGEILVTRLGGVGSITIDRPKRLNSLDVQAAQDLHRAAVRHSGDPEVRCIVVRASGGPAFCSGADLKYIRERSPRYGSVFRDIVGEIHGAILELRRAPKPVVAAVAGMAAAGGLGLAISCDLVVTSASASFEWAYKKTGLTGAESATFFLPRHLGLQRATAMMMLNRRLSAAEAHDLGLVSEVFADGDFDDEVQALARRLAAGPTQAFGVAKSLINESTDGGRLERHLASELDCLVEAADGPEFSEGVAAFFEKRSPRF